MEKTRPALVARAQKDGCRWLLPAAGASDVRAPHRRSNYQGCHDVASPLRRPDDEVTKKPRRTKILLSPSLGKYVPQVGDDIELRIICQAVETKAFAESQKAEAAREAAAKAEETAKKKQR